MTKGRKNLPDRTKQLKGTDQPVRINKNKPGYATLSELPNLRPNPLNKQGKSIYRNTGNQLINQGLLNSVNFELFVAYCNEMGIYYQMIEEIKDEGYTVTETTKSGIRTLINPKRRLANDALQQAQRLASEFGLSPATESKVSKSNDETEDPFQKLLNE
jgi:P27 family predicted phage terminase small subunit